jgi:hypothetical protein
MSLEELKLLNKILKAFPNSPRQLALRKELEYLRKSN